MALGLFIIGTIIKQGDLINVKIFDFMDYIFDHFFGMQISMFTKGLIMLLFFAVFMTITIFLRKKGIYDYRSRQEQWQEATGLSYYSRFNKYDKTK